MNPFTKKNGLVHALVVLLSLYSGVVFSYQSPSEPLNDKSLDCSLIKNPKELIGILNLFNGSDFSNEDPVFYKCNAYFIRKTRFGLVENQVAIKHMLADYCDAFNGINHCIENNKKIKPSDKWVKDFIDKFGKDTARQYKQSIQAVLEYLYKINESKVCIASEKNAVYSEFIFVDSLRIYLSIMIDFSKTLNATMRHKISQDIEICKKQLSEFENPPLSVMLSGGGLYIGQSSAAVQGLNDLPPNILSFMLENGSLSKPFDFFQAFDDFNRLIQ